MKNKQQTIQEFKVDNGISTAFKYSQDMPWIASAQRGNNGYSEAGYSETQAINKLCVKLGMECPL